METGKPRVGSSLLLLFCAVQPLLDTASFWLQQVSRGTMFTLALRAILLAAAVTAAFFLSGRKRIYFALAGICCLLYAGHLWAWRESAAPLSLRLAAEDFTNFIRVAQIPWLTLAFATFLCREKNGTEAVEKGLTAAFFLIFAVEVCSVATGTEPYTYRDKQIGLCGWFYFPNSQSAVLSMLFPPVLCRALQSGRPWRIWTTAVIGFGELYLFATRLAYLAVFVTAGGLLFTWTVCRGRDRRVLTPLLLCAVLCAAGFTVSPLKANRDRTAENAALKQKTAEVLLQKGTEEYGGKDLRRLTYVYDEFLDGLVDRFGLEPVAALYEESSDAVRLADVRTMKIRYCRLLLSQRPAGSLLFGMDYPSMQWNGVSYDVENDFHGLFFLYGIAGLGCFAAFLLSFFVRIVRALRKNARRFFTVQAGACGTALLMGLLHACFTAGVLRRPNASFYLSLLLALLWYGSRPASRFDAKEKQE